METKIVILLACTSFTLIFNSIVIWYAYKGFASMSTKMTSTLLDIESNESIRTWLKALESASAQAITITDSTKTQLTNFDPVLARAQAKYEFRLAQIDVNMEKSISFALHQTARLQKTLMRPAHRFGATLSGVHEVIRYFSGE